jgi:hypothetical protein
MSSPHTTALRDGKSDEEAEKGKKRRERKRGRGDGWTIIGIFFAFFGFFLDVTVTANEICFMS